MQAGHLRARLASHPPLGIRFWLDHCEPRPARTASNDRADRDHWGIRVPTRRMRLAPESGLAGPELLLDQADHPVVVAAATVDHAEAVALAVVEQVEVVADELHLEQRLVDGHRARRVHLLAQD